ncbi:MAG: ribokinase [Acidimicrobiia bacterium]|nr:ribokinase [Acidimicrobiia bacterium]
MADIVVVGSLNLDTTARVGRLPTPGETVLGTGHSTDTGGKGANQAVAAARLGRRVAMIGRVGDDDNGRRIAEVLNAEGIDVDGVTVDDTAPTGLAFITVDVDGENMIVVSPGANATLTANDLVRSAGLIGSASVVLLQLEIPLEVVHHAAGLATGTVILNPAPAADLPAGLLEDVAVLVPNRTELAALVGSAPASTIPEVAAQVDLLPVGAGVVTLGADGALVRSGGTTTHVPAPAVHAVDATAAGDAFCAALADALSTGADLEQATEWAVRVGAVTATVRGAQASLPTRDAVLRLR